MRAHAAVRAWWAGAGGPLGSALSWAALPLEGAYRAVVGGRNRAFDRGHLTVERAPVPVVSVGNLAVGGTGKTPIAAWIVGVLRDAGHHPALVARGYGDDELSLHRRWHPDAAVHGDPDRLRAARAAAAGGADCVVLDDGFQHRRLARDLDVVLVAAEHPFPGRLLPRGPFREPPSALARADVAVLTRRTADTAEADALAARIAAVAPDLALARARLAPRGWRDLAGASVDAPSGAVLAVSAVAEPESFVRMVELESGGPVDGLSFPDHHAYGPPDVDAIVRRASGRPVAVTEKDAVKLDAFAGALGDVRVLTLAVEMEAGGPELRERLLQAVER